ncbi:MAG: type II toxin-antitoxin system RelE/ParE family toxin [Chryseolinea sp.]
MVKLIWTDQAIDDLGDIGDYIAETSERYAVLTVQKLYERTDVLKSYPKLEELYRRKVKKTSEN